MKTVDYSGSDLLPRKKGKQSHDWRRWPRSSRLAMRAAEEVELAKLPKGSKVVARFSHCDSRPDLDGLPYQLYYEFTVKIP